MHLLAISTSTFGHQKSTIRKVLLYGVSRRQCTDYVPVRKRGKTTLQQAWRNLVFDASEANVYANRTSDFYIMVYVDDIVVIGDPTKVNKIFEKIQEEMLLKHTGYLDPGEKHYFLGRQIHNEGNYFDIKLDDD